MEVAGRPLHREDSRPEDSRNPGNEAGFRPGVPVLAQMKYAAARAIEALSEGKSVVVTGAPGTGKSTVMAGVLAGLGSGYSVLQLRGAASWSGRPFDGLLWLLSELPPESLSDPVYVLQYVRSVFRERATGRTLVLAVENIEDLDGATTAVLLQLCRAGSALILCTVRDLSACTGEFVRWWAEDGVHKESLEALRPSGTRALLEGLAGGAVSSRLVAQVQARSRGNPLLSALFLREQMDAGTVLRRRGTWVWTGAVSYSGVLAERVEAETGGLSAEERYAADVLAVSGSLPLLQLLELADPPAVERLEQDLLIASGPVRTVQLKDPLLAEAAAALVAPTRAAEIRSRLETVRELYASGAGNEPQTAAAARTAALNARDLSLRGRWAEAAAAAQVCRELMEKSAGAGSWSRELLSELFCVYVRCGDLRQAAALLAQTDEAAVELHGGNDLCEGIVQVLGGRADRALDYLQRALAQLEEEGPADLLPLAETAAAYACLLLNDGDAARGYLAAADQASGLADAGVSQPGGGLARRFAWLCAARGAAFHGETERPVDVGSGGAGEDLSGAMLALATAALQGCADAAVELGEAAAACSGDAADLYAELAEGLAASRPASMLHAAERAHGLGQYRMAYEAARGASRLAREQSARSLLRAARRIENVSYRMLSAAHSVADRLPELSDFERGLALEAAGGKSSSQLAASLHLSPRTIDWHLGRIFQKLRVTGRAELRECLEPERTQL
ncbi:MULTISPECIES: LuxR C-terminal-related transcriptional regulator [unclassified Arthrobacter]|uniref:LuxR C-terminal-related transcriptional regulator n=1 Tax=unclassified Arthrobacter TaxID=235627 RepID=UPI001E40BE93|nr:MULTISPECIES: LuxR C-terminal-related transcriptional regulator [unclassified Arthrobacter]MCC9146137.1 LuxR C-terminal-related transcriptional regulator [Arthrobacter sp. zg-Y919]MDK1277367.1 LuxR C-terminal-related transcriptional regulator [Arthrobacter sp. zg.Y919]WIB03864.1 LuxR C-terminal-related transcriptional regulator [Arthrobacter sp. zg-Y919]